MLSGLCLPAGKSNRERCSPRMSVATADLMGKIA
jgi:hypothetical protein